MAKKSDKSKKRKKTSADTSQAELVEALESIKGLLEQGEEKLSIARESIQRANESAQPLPRTHTTPAIPQSDEEEIVPVLDDIVEPDELELALDTNEADLDIPILSDNTDTTAQRELDPAADNTTTATTAKTDDTQPATNMRQTMTTVLDDELIDTIQTELEQAVRERLMKSMIRLENELKVEIRTQLDKLRNK